MMTLDSSVLSIVGNRFTLQKRILGSVNVGSQFGMICVRMPLQWGLNFWHKPHTSPRSAQCMTGVRCEVGQVTKALPASSSSSSSSSSTVASTEKSSFQRPSATREVVQEYKNQITAREEVMDFLKGEGIETREFESVELPPSIDIVKERLEFLCKLGLEKQHINEYPLMLCCSVKKNMVPVIDYLEKLGFTSITLQIFLRKYPMVLHTSVVVDLQPVVFYLEGLGIDRKDISTVLLKYPDVLGFRLEGTMSTSVAYLVSIGVGIREVGPMLTEYPQILGMRVGNNIKPKVDYICSLGLSKGAMANILAKHPYLLGLGLDDKLRPAIAALMRAGVREQALSAIIAQFPDIFAIDLDEKLPGKHTWLTKQLHIESDDVATIIEKLPQIVVINEGMAIERVNFLKESGGFKEDEITKMVPRCPQILALSIENALSPNLEYFKNEMKRPLQELVDFPAYLTYNLEERIRPRYQQIRRKGIKCSLSWFLNCRDSKFQERIAMDYVENAVAERTGFPFVMGESFGKKHQHLQDCGGELKPIISGTHKSILNDEGNKSYADGGKEALHNEEWSDEELSEGDLTEHLAYQVKTDMS